MAQGDPAQVITVQAEQIKYIVNNGNLRTQPDLPRPQGFKMLLKALKARLTAFVQGDYFAIQNQVRRGLLFKAFRQKPVTVGNVQTMPGKQADA